MLLNNKNYTQRMQALLLVVFTLCLTLLLHAVGLNNYLYWSYWWLDIITHALGGFALGTLSVIYIKRKYMWYALLLVLVSIISWEIFEVFIQNLRVNVPQYQSDTIIDTFIGIMSASVAVWIYYRKR